MGRRVGVVGGGIAGCAAAWSLDRAGFEVELFEAAHELGGNAKTHAWPVADERRVSVGLSVLAWPAALFRNYRALLRTLGVATQEVELRFFIRAGAEVFAHGREGGLARRYADDLRRWRRLVERVRAINRLCSGGATGESLYRLAPHNPMNLIPLWPLARWFGISRGFWDDVVVPFYSATFLSTRLDRIPAVILPTIDAILAIDAPGRLETWSGSSREVFDKLTASFAERTYTNRAIVRIAAGPEGVTLTQLDGREHRFDEVVLACPAPAIARALVEPRRLQRRLLTRISYADASDPTFAEGLAHGDPTVIPAADRNAVLDGHCNYVEVSRGPDGTPRYENHFVLSSWLPAARGHRTPMLVSYNAAVQPSAGHLRARVDNRHAHPELSIGNLGRALLWRLLQGRDHLHYCGSLATPGNGHDLSLLSGLVVAERIGAPYPFADDLEARADFVRLRRIMLGRV